MNQEGKLKFTFPTQIALVVKDCEKTKEFYSTLGIGPWWLVEQDYPEIIVRGRKSSYKIKIATADWGGMDLKLVQPLSGRSLYSEFLDQGREGFHHMTFDLAKEEREQVIANLKKEGYEVYRGWHKCIRYGCQLYAPEYRQDRRVIF